MGVRSREAAAGSVRVPGEGASVYNIATGEKTDERITLDNRVFGMPLREDILHRVVVWQLAKRRQGTHCVKTLSEIR